MGEPKPVKKALGEFGQALGIVLGILCGVATFAAWLAKPEGWPYMVIMLAICTAALVVWLILASRAKKRADEIEIRCGGDEWVGYAGVNPGDPNIPDNLWCGYSVPEWFTKDLFYGEADDDESEPAPPRCARCRSGKQIRYPKRLETESEYIAYLAKKAESDKASLRDFERLAANLPQRRIEEPANDTGTRVGADSHNGSAVESESEAEAEKEAGEKEGRRR